MVKRKTSLSLSDEAIRLRDELAQAMGLSGAAVVEVALRELAASRGVEKGYPMKVDATATYPSPAATYPPPAPPLRPFHPQPKSAGKREKNGRTSYEEVEE